jgi:hypothetical protein
MEDDGEQHICENKHKESRAAKAMSKKIDYFFARESTGNKNKKHTRLVPILVCFFHSNE